MQQDPQYQKEEGLTEEANLLLYMDNLLKNQTVTDAWQGKGKTNRLVGSYVSGNVPDSCWSRDNRRSSFNGYDPDDRNSNDGFRSAARFTLWNS